MRPYLCDVKKLLLFICLTILMRPIFPVIEYAVNYDYISKVLCINKEKPKMHCNGKCHLMKNLAAASESEKPLSQDKKTQTVEKHDWFAEVTIVPVPLPIETFTKQMPSVYRNLYHYRLTGAYFHPPTLIS